MQGTEYISLTPLAAQVCPRATRSPVPPGPCRPLSRAHRARSPTPCHGPDPPPPSQVLPLSAVLLSPPQDARTPLMAFQCPGGRGFDAEGSGIAWQLQAFNFSAFYNSPPASRATFYTEHVELCPRLPETQKICHFRLCHKNPCSATHLKVSQRRTEVLFYFCMQDSKALWSYNAFMVPRDKIFFKKRVPVGKYQINGREKRARSSGTYPRLSGGFLLSVLNAPSIWFAFSVLSGSKFPAAQQKEKQLQGALEELIALPAIWLGVCSLFPGV